jgi:hypothetical protein
MKRLLQACVLAAILFSLDSCGLPMAVARSAGRVVNGAAGLASGG